MIRIPFPLSVTVEVAGGDIDDNILALDNAIDLKPLSSADVQLLMDTRSILHGIKEQLNPKGRKHGR